MPYFLMIYIVPETNQIAIVSIELAIDDNVNIVSSTIINPKSLLNKYARLVVYTELYNTTPVKYEDIPNRITARTNGGTKGNGR